jgi:hypothetical protein
MDRAWTAMERPQGHWPITYRLHNFQGSKGEKQTLNWVRLYVWRDVIPDSHPMTIMFSKQIMGNDDHTTNPDAVFTQLNK